MSHYNLKEYRDKNFDEFTGTVLVSKDRKQILLLGAPDDKPDDEANDHNCDAMGCSSIDHVIARAEVYSEGW
jgi:hypothetical protein